ncbi:MAG: DUF1501 domain-containing protein [Anaerolineae bacterium]|nr:DUF1501 domain-containing protein [Anaerolineae bacterium]HRA19072.1 DUF1501 domain-containing protein [Anaerolineae bacterium]
MITRRSLFERSGVLALSTAVWPSWMPRMAFRKENEAPKGDILIVVFARGGYDGLNMVIPYLDEANYNRLRPSIAIPAPDANAARKAIDLDGSFGLHPALGNADEGRWKQWWDEGILGMVHAVAMDNDTRSHFDAMDFMERGTPGSKMARDGWLGRHLSTLANQNASPFRAVGLGSQLQASLRGPVPAIALQSIADFHLQGKTGEVVRFQQHLQMLYSGNDWLDQQGQATFAALDLLEKSIGGATYQPANGARYGNDGFSRGMMQIAQLVKAEVGLEVACVDIGGWDTHANQVVAGDTTNGNMATRMRELAGGISALITDLHDRFESGATKQGVTVVVMSEFGRRAFENGGTGTDHGHGNVMFTFGRGIKGHKVYTNRWPGLADDDLDRGDLARTTEYRDVLGEILLKRTGNTNIADVFPGHAFNFLGLANDLGPTVAPTNTPAQPTAVPTTPPEPTTPPVGPSHRIFIPNVGNK